MTTFLIDESSIGTVIIGFVALTKVAVTTMPAKGSDADIGPLTLVENSGVPRPLIHVPSDTIGAIVGPNLSMHRGGLGVGPVIGQYTIPFSSLLVQSVPKGASFELTVQ
jgi:hypothetical protein